jgi:peptidoglycan/LPS O-acetylase OafA/YrhL
MIKGVSGYLDLVRIAAALEVFFYHLGHFRSGFGLPLFAYGHQAVIVFFILSGYVIAYVAAERETDAFSFGSSRAARIYSVAVPALALTALIDLFLLSKASVPLSHNYQLIKAYKYVPLFLVFGTDWWFLDEDAFSNAPYWSLCYEVWYYVLFSCWIYLGGNNRRLWCPAVLLLVGPRLWLLLPVWLSGVALYHYQPRPLWPRAGARAVWLLTLAATGALLATGLYSLPSDLFYQAVGPELRHWLRYSQFFLSDYALTVLVVFNLAAVKSCDFQFARWAKPIRYVAGLTFALYLFHYPLLEFYGQWLAPVPLALAVLLTVWGLGSATERLRASLRSWLFSAFAPPESRVRSS